MKSANFSYKTKSRVIYGVVTLKNDGKTSISLKDVKYGTCYMDRYYAKQLAQAIVKSNFVHEAIIGTVRTDENQKGLIANLTEQTQQFKVTYLQRVKEWATRVYRYAETKKKWTPAKWIEEYGEEQVKGYRGEVYTSMQMIEGRWQQAPMMQLTKAGRESKAHMNQILSNTFEKHLDNQRLAAERHYEDSIARLAARLNNKGVNDETKMTITQVALDINFEMTIKHDDTTTRAWTIIAEGPIKRPHYRFLVR